MLDGFLDSHGSIVDSKDHPLSKIKAIASKLSDCERLYSEELKKPNHYSKNQNYMQITKRSGDRLSLPESKQNQKTIGFSDASKSSLESF